MDRSDLRSLRTFVWCSAATIPLGAFLLFQIQPLIGKSILPWFGGSPAVWTTCMLFFQTLLLVGYLYSHLLTRFLPPTGQALLTGALLLLAVATLAITPGLEDRPPDSTAPMWRISLLLLRHVGIPYFLLASTAPLVQAWCARRLERPPYRLYALSNAASLAALLSYPFLFEPAFSTGEQGRLWSAAFVGFACLYGGLAVAVFRSGLPVASAPSAGPGPARPGSGAWIAWLGLPAFASALLLAMTNQLCADIAVIPFLWVVPLSLYLLSFVLCFDRDAWYSRSRYGPGTALAILLACFVKYQDPLDAYVEAVFGDVDVIDYAGSLPAQLGVHLLVLFLVCMLCHGELARRRPAASSLTAFYLAIASGGALGSAFVALCCPLLFSSYVELNLGLVVAFGLAIAASFASGGRGWLDRAAWRRPAAVGAAGLATLVVLVAQWLPLQTVVLDRRRGFYGVLSVEPELGADGRLRGRWLVHGNVVHGFQFVDPERAMDPTGYYHPRSGVGIALRRHRAGEPRRVGVIGLGAGVLAAYGRPSDVFRFYEINPDAVALARRHFTFLERSLAEVEVVLADARLALEREPTQDYDLLVLDAFSGDAIPVHLLTQEAFAVYGRHLKRGGVLAVHASNAYLELEPVVAAQAEHSGLGLVRIDDDDYPAAMIKGSTWLLLTQNPEFLADREVRAAASPPETLDAPVGLWTDQRNDLFSILK